MAALLVKRILHSFEHALETTDANLRALLRPVNLVNDQAFDPAANIPLSQYGPAKLRIGSINVLEIPWLHQITNNAAAAAVSMETQGSCSIYHRHKFHSSLTPAVCGELLFINLREPVMHKRTKEIAREILTWPMVLDEFKEGSIVNIAVSSPCGS